MNPEQISNQSYGLLLRVLEQVYAAHEKGDLRQAFIYRHAQTILRLSEDVFHLEAEQRCYSSAIVVRAMLESLFNLAAAVKCPEFAAQKVIWEAEDEVKRIKKWMGDDGLKDTVETLENFAQSLRRDHRVTSISNWNTFKCAEAAALDEHYRGAYFLFSKNAHGNTSGMLGAENGITRGQVFQTVVFVLLCATAHVVQILPTKQPQRHLNRATNLLEKLSKLVERGEFRKLNRAEET